MQSELTQDEKEIRNAEVLILLILGEAGGEICMPYLTFDLVSEDGRIVGVAHLVLWVIGQLEVW